MTTPSHPPDAQDVQLRLLGAFAVSIGGAPIAAADWSTLRAAQLVQLLALSPQRALPREQVIDALWPQLDAEAGGANLRKAAHHARQAMGLQEAVVLQRGAVLLCPGMAVTVDADAFEHEARAALASGDPARCARAAEAYAGDLLPASPYEPWAEMPRTRLRQRYLELLRRAAAWERLAEAEPTDEEAHRELMRQALARGNRAAALRWYARVRAALQSALGVAPDRATEALYEECVAGLQPPAPPFLGRETELARIGAWLRRPPREQSGVLVIRGPAGIGKSALCGQAAGLARSLRWTVVHVDAVQPERPYAVVAAAVEQLVRDRPDAAAATGAQAQAVLSMLTPLVAAPARLPGPLSRHQVIGALRRILLAASGGEPALVVVDDAHLVEDGDADVLLHLAASGRPVCVMLATRPLPERAHLARGLGWLARTNALERIDLGPLPDEDAAELVKRAAPAAAAPDVVRRVVGLAEGNAFAALELARCIAARGSDARLPRNAREAITERLCDVDDAVMALLRRLALAGDELDAATITALHPGTESEAFSLLDQALAAGVIVVADARYRFRHELVRQALMEETPPHQRLKVHRDAARRLAEHGAPPVVVARHWLAGGSLAEAVPWLLHAARDAVRVAAYADALHHLEPLLAHAPSHAEALRLRAEALEALGDPAAVAAYRDAAAAADESTAHDLRAKGALAQLKQGDPKGALEALAGVRPASVEGRLAEALAYSGAAALGFADPAMGTAKAAESRRLALQTGDTAAIVVASWAQAAAAHARGELHGSVWTDLHETHHVPHLAVRVFDGHLCITQRFLYGARPYAEVIGFADKLAEEARRLGAARGHAFGVTLRGEAELLSGDLDAAEAHLVLGGRLHRAIGGATGEALSLQRRAELALHRGERERARDLLDEALDLARQTDIGFHLLDRIYGTRIALAADPDAAVAAVEEAQEAVRGFLETCPGCRITFAVPATVAAARARRLDLTARYAPAVEYLAKVVMKLPAWDAAFEEVQAHIARARGAPAADVASQFAAAARRFREAGHPLDAARCEGLAATPR